MKEPRLLLVKSHVAAYTRKDGTFVKEHHDKRSTSENLQQLKNEHSIQPSNNSDAPKKMDTGKHARKTIDKKVSKKGVQFALVTDGVTYEVWVLRENYDGKVKGGMSKTWRYVEKGLTEEAARKLFNRRAA